MHVVASMGLGGAESVVVQLVRAGQNRGWQSAVASDGGLRAAQLLADGAAEIFRVPLVERKARKLVLSVYVLGRAMARFRPDVILAHNVGSTAVAGIARQFSRKPTPLISIFHGVAAQDYKKARWILDLSPDAVVVVSRETRERLNDAGMRRDDAVVIPNAVSAPILPAKDEARRSLDLDKLTPVAICLARLVPQKRHDVLLRAWAGLARPATLLLAGEGDERAQLEVLSRELGVQESVQFLGGCDDVRTLLAAADVSTLSSDWEGLPMAVLESMASGLPIVATAVDGIRSLVHAGEGTLVKREDPVALRLALANYLFDPERAQLTGQNAKRGVIERHSLSAMVDSYADVLGRVQDGRVAPKRVHFTVGRDGGGS
jgi:glycosyltransferase involved in cell wall biosynthesis